MTAHRRLGFGLSIAGAVAAAGVALAAATPAAQADTVELPDIPDLSGNIFDQESLGGPPFFDGIAFEQNGTYTNLLGLVVNSVGQPAPLDYDSYGFPGTTSLIDPVGGIPTGAAPLQITEINDPNYFAPGGIGPNGDVLGSTFGEISTTSGLYNFYEDTPFFSNTATSATDNYNDTFVYDPTGNPVTDLSGIEFGIQYLDLPDAAVPVDEINLLGSGGEILLSIPVTGDLFTLF